MDAAPPSVGGTDTATTLRRRLGPFAVHAALLIAAIAWYPTDALSLSSNRVENELLQNGYSSFFRAAATNHIDYRDYYASADPASNLKVLAGALVRAAASSRDSPRGGWTAVSRRVPMALAGSTSSSCRANPSVPGSAACTALSAT